MLSHPKAKYTGVVYFTSWSAFRSLLCKNESTKWTINTFVSHFRDTSVAIRKPPAISCLEKNSKEESPGRTATGRDMMNIISQNTGK